MESDWKLSIQIFQYNLIHHAIHNHYKVITLTQSTQSACKFGCSKFRSKLSVPQTVSVQEQKFSSFFEVRHRQRGKLTLVEALSYQTRMSYFCLSVYHKEAGGSW